MSENEIKTKICRGENSCGLEKPLNEFGKSKRHKDGLLSMCKKCRNIENKVGFERRCANDPEYAEKDKAKNCAYMAKKRAEDPDEANRKTREWKRKQVEKDPDYWMKEYYKNPERNRENARKFYHKNTEVILVKQKIWRAENPEVYLNASRRWKENNKERYRANHREWTKNNAEHVRNYNRMRRAHARGATIQDFSDEQLMQRMSVYGFKCAYCDEGNFEHIDHVIPLSKGGKHCLANLRPACAPCNLSKHNKSLKDWLEYRKQKVA